MSEHLGRQVKYGIGVETTPGTAVTASKWFNQLSFELNPVVTTVNNESSWGNLVKTNSANVVRRHAEGKAEAKLTPDLGGLLLALAFGNSSSTAVAGNAGVYDHTINLTNDIIGKTATFVKQDDLSTEAYAGGRIGEWALSLDLDGYLKYTASIFAQAGVTAAATPVYTEDVEFVASHFNVKQAATIGAIGAASNLSTVESFSITANANIEADNAAGSKSPRGFSSRGYDLSFEMTTRYADRTFEDAYKNGTSAAFQVTIENDDEVIGTNARGKFVFTAPRVTISEWTREASDLDAPVTQSMTGTIHYSPTDLYALRAVVTNRMQTLL